MEPRFFLPLYVLIYMLVCFSPQTLGATLPRSKRGRLALSLSCLAFVLGSLTLSLAVRGASEYPISAGLSASRPELELAAADP
jgi:hypothetical protein